MNLNPNGFVANVVFRGKGERKPMGICSLLPRFLWQLTLMTMWSVVVLLGRILTVIPMLVYGERPVLNWIIPSPWARRPAPWGTPYLTAEQQKKVDEIVVRLETPTMTLYFAIAIGVLLWAALALLGAGAVFFGLENSYIANRFGTYTDASNTLHGLMVVLVPFATFLVFMLLKRWWGQSEFGRLLVIYFKARKDKVCPIVTFE